MNYRWRIKTNSIIFIFIFGVFILMSILFNVDISFMFVFSVWIALMYYSLKNIKNNILLAFFLASFFVFLLGGHFVYEYFGMELRHYLGYEYYLHSNVTMGVALVFLFIGIKTTERIIKYVRPNINKDIMEFNTSEEGENRVLLRNIAKVLYLCTYIFFLSGVLDKVLFVINNTYRSYYVDYKNNMPLFVNLLAAMTPYFFFLYLATLPSKKEVRPLLILHVLYAIISVFAGGRIEFMTIILFVVIYYIFRHYNNNGKEQWITKKHVTIAIMMIPVLLIALFSYNYIRNGQSISEFSFKQMLLGFFQQQGFSSSVIRLGLYNQDVLQDGAYYSFFGLVRWSRTNTLLNLFYEPQYDFSYAGNSISYALKGNSLAHALSYHTLSTYLLGSGVGSCYIAELYHDFGYIGIAIGNSIYGAIIATISKLWHRIRRYNVWVTAICFSLVESFLKAPRWNFDIVFTDILSLGMWSAFLCVFLCYKYLNSMKEVKYIQRNYREG